MIYLQYMSLAIIIIAIPVSICPGGLLQRQLARKDHVYCMR